VIQKTSPIYNKKHGLKTVQD